jgi:hypothetical protein
MTTTPDLSEVIADLTFAQLTELITRAEERRTQLRSEMRTQLERDAELIGLSVRDNGPKPRKRRGNAHKQAD